MTRGTGGLAVIGLALISGCELKEIQIATPENVVIAEIVLRAGAATQLAWLHRTRGNADGTYTVTNARIEVNAIGSPPVMFVPAPDTACMFFRDDTAEATHGSCYRSPAVTGAITGPGGFPSALVVTPAMTYQLRIVLADGGVLTGATTVPGDFRIVRPTSTTCSIAPLTTFDIRWTSAANSWVYASEVSMRGIKAALMPYGVTLNEEPLRLLGLSVTRADTTIVFPGGFGLFDRFDEDLTEALVFLQKGLPAGVTTDVVIGAADRNFVNWERGGGFNPSGPIRVPSIRGDGTGVFGSVVPKTFQVRIADQTRPAC